VYKSRLLQEQFEIIMKKNIVDISVKLPLVLIAILAVTVSGTSSLLFHYLSGNIGNGLAQFAYAASSDSIFGDVPATTDSDDADSDDSKQGGSNNINNNNDDGSDKKPSKQVTTSSSSNIAPQAKTGSTLSSENYSNSSAETLSGTKDVSIIGINQDNSFDPNPIEIKAGESVTWTNNDNEIHDITSGNEEEGNMGHEFSSGVLSSGKSFSHTFDKAGTYPYFCSFHESMTGEVIVK
jgi:plastocyanin